jgi:thiamine-monophosphate kinase
MPAGTPSFGRPGPGEFQLIRSLARRFGRTGPRVHRGIGDDAAVVQPGPGDILLLTTDLLAEGVHFRRDTARPEDIGFKAAVANLSDIAAMGGTPQFVLVSLAIPSGWRAASVGRLYKGLMEACRPHGVELVGGDTSSSLQGLFISVTLTGYADYSSVLTRSAARAGDLIYVTGTLGDSLAGLGLLQNHCGAALTRREAGYLVGRHRRPAARIQAGRLLARHRLASAAIDLSDGLSGDLPHLCAQSGVGAEILADSLPLSPACRAYASARALDPVSLALQGGEDYELLFTVPPGHRDRVDRLAGRAGCLWSPIGVIRPSSFGLRLRLSNGRLRKWRIAGYEHFRNWRSPAQEAACSR